MDLSASCCLLKCFWMISRIISGAIGLAILVGTVMLAWNLLALEPDARVLLAAYMGIGGILLGAYLLFFAITGAWRPNPARRKEQQEG